MKRLFFNSIFLCISATLFFGVISDAHANTAPIAKAKVSVVDSQGNRQENTLHITVYSGEKYYVSMYAGESSDPDGWRTSGEGITSYKGRCEITTPQYLLGYVPPIIIDHPNDPWDCSYVFNNILFKRELGTYTIRLLRIRDAQGLYSDYNNGNILTVTVVPPPPSNHPPVAVSKIKANNSPYGSEVAVTRGVPTHIYLSADGSSDPNGWTTALLGVSQGGKCEWNTDLNLGTTTYERTISNPANASACNIDLGNRTFNDPPGRYIYPVLRITDASFGVSNVASVTVIVSAPTPVLTPTPTPTIAPCGAPTPTFVCPDRAICYIPSPTPCVYPTFSPAPTPSSLPCNDTPNAICDPGPTPTPTPPCDPYGYNSNCSTPTPTTTLTPTPTNTPEVCPPGIDCTVPCPPGIDCTVPCPPGVDCTVPCPPGVDCTDPCPPGTICATVDGIIDNVIDTVDDVVHRIQDGINALVNTIAKGIAALLGLDPEKVAKFIKNAGKSLTNLALALGIPLIIANLLPQLANWGRFLGSFFGAHHRKDRWGIVVDSDLGKPIAGAVVQVFDAAFNNLKETQITGKDGQFGFLLIPGKYYVVTSASGFTFPARKKPPITLREHERIYLGEEFTISDANPESIPHLVVPLDREEKVSNTRAIFARFLSALFGFVDRVGFTLLFVGAGINTYLLLLSPNTLNVVFEVLYLLLFCLKFYILVFQQKGVGMVTDGATGGKLDLAIVRLYDAATNRIVQTRVTNKNGRFFLLVPKGVYTASISKPGYETLTQSHIVIKKSGSEAISLDFSLKKQA